YCAHPTLLRGEPGNRATGHDRRIENCRRILRSLDGGISEASELQGCIVVQYPAQERNLDVGNETTSESAPAKCPRAAGGRLSGHGCDPPSHVENPSAGEVKAEADFTPGPN